MIDNNTDLDELPAEMAETLTAFFRAKSPSTSHTSTIEHRLAQMMPEERTQEIRRY